MNWTQEEINAVYLEVQKKAMIDEEFRERILTDFRGAIEELTGKTMPDDINIKVIENDPAYTATFVLPELLSDEIEDDDLDSVAGGISVILIASACAAALSVGGCPANACAANAGK